MQTWDAIRARRNVRQYTGQPTTSSASVRRGGAHRRRKTGSRGTSWSSPTANSWPSWRRRGSGAGATSSARRRRSPWWPRNQKISGTGTGCLYEFGQATAFMMLAAADLGIGSGHSSVADQQQAQRVLGFPDGYRAVYLIGLGYPADRPLRPISRSNRPPFDEVVHWNHW